MLAVDRLSTLAQLERLAPEWQALWKRVGRTTPFQSPSWLIAWWRYFGQGHLRCLAVRAADRLVAVAPLFQNSSGTLTPIGAGISDYLDVLIEDGWAAAAYQAMLAAAAEDGYGQSWEFHDLPPDAALLKAARADPDGICQTGEYCPVLPLPDRVEALGAVVPRSMLQKLAYYRRLAGRHGSVRIEAARPDNLTTLYDMLLRLHAARWSSRGGAGVLGETAIQGFHREAAAGLLASGVLRLYALHIGDRPAAVFYGMHAKGATYYYLGGFDPALNRLSPGTLIVGYAIEQAVWDGAREFNFLRGQEAYKYRWGAKDRQSYIRILRCNSAHDAKSDHDLAPHSA